MPTMYVGTGSQIPPGVDRQREHADKMITTFEFLATWLRARFGDDEHGASLVEYALLVALIAVVCIAAVTLLGSKASEKLSAAGSAIGN
jgi:pilus assembly protein Flp/PilA